MDIINKINFIVSFRDSVKAYRSIQNTVNFIKQEDVEERIRMLMDKLSCRFSFADVENDETIQKVVENVYKREPEETTMSLNAYRAFMLFSKWKEMMEIYKGKKIKKRIKATEKLISENGYNLTDYSDEDFEDIKDITDLMNFIFDNVIDEIGDARMDSYVMFKQNQHFRDIVRRY